jgi:hypothetical protein
MVFWAIIMTKVQITLEYSETSSPLIISHKRRAPCFDALSISHYRQDFKRTKLAVTKYRTSVAYRETRREINGTATETTSLKLPAKISTGTRRESQLEGLKAGDMQINQVSSFLLPWFDCE